MTNYARLYRFGLTPWECYGKAAAASIAAFLDREESERARPLGRALDLGCGRGQYTPELARRGWEATGIDYVPSAIAVASSKAVDGVTYVVGDVTDLTSAGLGTFDFFLDIGCFQGLDTAQRFAEGLGVTAWTLPSGSPRAGVSQRWPTQRPPLMLAFGRTRMRAFVGGVSQADVETAFPDWELIAVEPADTAGLGWPMNRTSPQWFRLRSRD